MLRGMGFDNNTSIYVASGKIYEAQKHLAPLLSMFPYIYTKESLATPDELAPFQVNITAEFLMSTVNFILHPCFITIFRTLPACFYWQAAKNCSYRHFWHVSIRKQIKNVYVTYQHSILGLLFQDGSSGLHRKLVQWGFRNNSRWELSSFLNGPSEIPLQRPCQDHNPRQSQAGFSAARHGHQVNHFSSPYMLAVWWHQVLLVELDSYI